MLVASVGTLIGQVIRKIGNPTVVNDQELLQRYVQNRSEAAFEELMHRHGALVWGVCQRMLSHKQDTEDAFQATFIVLSKKAGTVHRPERLAHWLYGVACFAARNVRKGRLRRKFREQSVGELHDVPDHRHTLWNEVSPLVDDELARLPSKYRLPLVLCCLEGMTHQDAAKLLHWPIGTLAGRISRGRELLRHRLMKQGVVVSSAMLTGFLSQEVMAGYIPATVISSCVRGIFTHSTVGLAGHAITPTVTSAVSSTLQQLFVVRFALVALSIIVAASICTGMIAGWRVLAQQQQPAVVLPPQDASSNHLPVADPRYVRLPMNPDAVVLNWSQIDVQDDKLSWELSIKADGRVVAVLRQEPGAKPARSEAKLSPQELQQLVQFAVHDQEFTAFDESKAWNTLLTEYEFEGDMKAPRDTLMTEIRLQTAEREHIVQWYQLGSTEVWFHEVKAIKQLVQLHARLKNKALVMQAGGDAAVEAVAGPMYAMLKSTYPKLSPFDASHLTHYVPSQDGLTSRWTFSHGSKFGNPQYFSATGDRMSDGKVQLVSTIPGPGDIVPTMKRRIKNNNLNK